MRVIKLDRASTPGRVSISGVIDTGDGTKHVAFTPSHPRWSAAEEAVDAYYNASSTNEELAEALHTNFSLGDTVNDRLVTVAGVSGGRLKVEGNRVTFDGDPIDSVLEGHILRLLHEDGTPRDSKNWGAFARFVENLYGNVSEYVRGQLFGWLSYEALSGHGFTLTEDGCFIGYKGCAGTPDAPRSINQGTAVVNGKRHTGAIPNPVGGVVEMPRSEVQFDPRVGCAAGLHVGTLAYAKGWSQGVILTVKVNPRDVVSVPRECDAQKIRTCRYTILEVMDNPYTRSTYYSDSEDDLLRSAHDLAGAASDGTAVNEGDVGSFDYTTAVNEGDVVSFDYTTLDGRSNHYEVTVRYLNNYHLDGTRSDGGKRSFRVDRIKNMVNRSISDADDSSASVDTVDDSGDSQDSSAGSGAQVAPGTVVTIQYRKRYSHPVRTYRIRVTSSDQDYVNGDLTDGMGRRSFLRDRIVSLTVEDASDGDSATGSPNPMNRLADWVNATAQSVGLNLTVSVGDPSDADDPGTEEDEEVRRHGYGSGNAWDCN